MKVRSLALLSVVLGACGDLPEPSRVAKPSSPQGTGANPAADPVADDFVAAPIKPELAELPETYGYETIPVRGQAEPQTTVVIETDAAAVSVDTDERGSFCRDIALAPGKTNRISAYTQNIEGVFSERVSAQVAQDGSLAQYDEVLPPLLTLDTELSMQADELPKEGSLTAAHDGDPTTSILVMESSLWANLGETLGLSSIVLQFPDSPGNGDNTFATVYQIYGTTSGHPVLPASDESGDWFILADVYPGSFQPAGDGGLDTIAFDEPVPVRFVSFHFVENNKIDWFSSENIRIGDISLRARSLAEPERVPRTPSCENGRIP